MIRRNGTAPVASLGLHSATHPTLSQIQTGRSLISVVFSSLDFWASILLRRYAVVGSLPVTCRSRFKVLGSRFILTSSSSFLYSVDATPNGSVEALGIPRYSDSFASKT